MKKILLTLLMPLFLFGCTTPIQPWQRLGIAPKDWQKYSLQKQTELINNYNQLLDMSTAGSYIAHKNSCLAVTISDGEVMFPPFISKEKFTPIDLKIPEGTCREVFIQNDKAKIQTKTYVCYVSGMLELDPSTYDLSKKYGSVHIYYSPLWANGFDYKNINSSGYARFSNTKITITETTAPPEQCNITPKH